MWVVCKCGVKRATQPWKLNTQVEVTACQACSPGRLDRFPRQSVAVSVRSTADQIREFHKRRSRGGTG